MILPWNGSDPAGVAIATLWGIAASLLVRAILNGRAAGPASEAGAKSESLASIARTTGLAVGRGVGFGVGRSVGRAVGLAVGLVVGRAVGRAVGAAVRVGAGVGSLVGAGVATALGLAADAGDGEAVGDAVGITVAVGRADGLREGAALAAASDAEALGWMSTLGEASLGTAPPQAAKSRHAGTSRTKRGMGIAAL
jgi:hypothetical protein